MKIEKLFDQFPAITTKEWMDKIHSDLKGADYNRKLVWKTNEGFDVQPFYRMEDTDNLKYINVLPGEYPYIRGTKVKNNNWSIRQDIEIEDYSEANLKALSVLMKGIDSLGFIIKDPESVSEENFRILLRDILTEVIEINFRCEGKAQDIFDHVTKISAEKGVDPENLCGAIETDPVGRLMKNGNLCVPVATGFDYLASLTKSATTFPNIRTVHLNASYFNNAGADIVQELAFGISMGVEYLTQLTGRGINAGIAATKIRFSFGIGSDYFREIAKLRAARLLWSVVIKGFLPEESESIKMDMHCVTSEWNKTVYDPYVNMLRTQTEAMSAILGGTDSLTVEPFDIVFRQPDEFSERIARNQQLILKEEAYFNKVADPAAGSYYIETLTNLIAESSWKLFLEIEDLGGFISTMKAGYIQKKISESAFKRKGDLATGKSVLLGTNHYPDTEESLSPLVELERVFGNISVRADTIIDPIKLFRGSEEYEKVRIAVDKAKKRPVVFILPIGNPVLRKVRAQFTVNYFGCAGYHTIDNKGFDNTEDGISSAIESKANLVVICSSDDEYLQFVPDICNGLKGKSIIVVAGNPAFAGELKLKGVDMFIHAGTDMPEFFNALNRRLGIRL